MSDTNKNENQNPTEPDEIPKTSDELDTSKTPEMEAPDHDTSATTTKTESDYESADSEEETEEDRLRKRDEEAEDNSEDEDADGEGVATGEEEEDEEEEREEGDGQESVPAKEKKLDDDEDRRNPQYIPKKGTFYEHDDRGADEEDAAAASAAEKAKEEDKTKKPRKEISDKWSHDKFNELDQAPKSRDELVNSYGYDIRSEEGPPRARRRRRYGRGPNKYDRNWEDENAYSKPTRGGGVMPRGGRRSSEGGRSMENLENLEEIQVHSEEQFPSLNQRRGAPRGRKNERPVTRDQKPAAEQRDQQTTPPRPTNQPSRGGRGRGSGPSGRIVRGSGRIVEGRGRGGRPRDDVEEEHAHLENNIKNLSIKESNGEQRDQPREIRRQQKPKGDNYQQTPPTERRQANVPPRMQQEGSGSRPKRYSSQRQRSLPESSAAYDQPPAPAGNYYEQGYQQHQVYPEGAPGQPAAVAPQVPVTSATQILPPGATFTPSYPSPTPAPAFIAPAQAPARIFPGAPQPAAPFMAPPNPQIMNFVQPPATQFPPTFPPFQSFPAVPPAAPPQPPPEIYVPSGITYYSTQNQVPRPTPLKRPKAAIPIVPPPVMEGKQEDQIEGSTGEELVDNSKEVDVSSTEIVHKVEEAKPEIHPTEISA